MNNNNNIGWLFFGEYKNILPSMLTILPSSSTRAILLTSLAIYSCIPLKAIQYYISIFIWISLDTINEYHTFKCTSNSISFYVLGTSHCDCCWFLRCGIHERSYTIIINLRSVMKYTISQSVMNNVLSMKTKTKKLLTIIGNLLWSMMCKIITMYN